MMCECYFGGVSQTKLTLCIFMLPQRLIFYLNDSGLVDQNIIKQILGTTDKQFDRLQPEFQKTISTQVLGELASEISTSSMETVALGWLGLSNGEVKATKYDSFRKSWLFNLGILELYSTKPYSSLQVSISLKHVEDNLRYVKCLI